MYMYVLSILVNMYDVAGINVLSIVYCLLSIGAGRQVQLGRQENWHNENEVEVNGEGHSITLMTGND